MNFLSNFTTKLAVANIVNTGDNNLPIILGIIAVIVIAAGVIVGLQIYRKKKDNSKNNKTVGKHSKN